MSYILLQISVQLALASRALAPKLLNPIAIHFDKKKQNKNRRENSYKTMVATRSKVITKELVQGAEMRYKGS
jgi:hypothetical protein